MSEISNGSVEWKEQESLPTYQWDDEFDDDTIFLEPAAAIGAVEHMDVDFHDMERLFESDGVSSTDLESDIFCLTCRGGTSIPVRNTAV